jgi:hypothetical protein
VGPRWRAVAKPWIVRGLGDVVLEFIERLRAMPTM